MSPFPRDRTPPLTRTLLAGALAFLAAALPAQAPPRSIAPPESVVADEFIGYLLALVRDDRPISVAGEELSRLFPEYDDDAETPFDVITLFERESGERRVVRLRFSEPMRYPAPIDILGHHPVMLYSSLELAFDESAEEQIDMGSPGSAPAISRAYVLTRSHGEFRVDFARWLDALLGGFVDDVTVEVVLAAEYAGEWYGAMAGYSPAGSTVTSVYSMRRDRFLIRPPEAITRFALERIVKSGTGGRESSGFSAPRDTHS